MDLYTSVAYQNSRTLTLRYSSSFGLSSRLLGRGIRPHIYAIYGLVRIADEIVDTYKGDHSLRYLDDLEAEVYDAFKIGYSSNPIVHAFAQTGRKYKIGRDLIKPFFASMRFDLAPHTYQESQYKAYIHGSAEVIGLMCLKVFCQGNSSQYESLKNGAAALGSAYQKINFLRDFAADYKELGRVYFPGVSFEAFSVYDKQQIITDITRDLEQAKAALGKLPRSARLATTLSYVYYSRLLLKLDHASPETIRQKRLRLSTPQKLLLFARTLALEGWKR